MTDISPASAQAEMSDSKIPPVTADERRSAIWALSLLAPVPSIGILCASFGQGGEWVWMATKVWLLSFPVLWWKLRDRQKLSLSPVRHGGLWMGVVTGIAIGLVILAGHWGIGRHIIEDGEVLRDLLREKGITDGWRYLGLAVYLSLVNAITEEYVWRWFVFVKCEALTSRMKAVLLSAFLFTVHHFVILAIYFGPLPALIASAGVFSGGVIWSWLYLKYRSVWPSYISHIGADAAVFYVGWLLLDFG